MQIVIDIPDDNYKRIRELAEVNGLSNNLMGYSLLAIAHGIVLPEGHGDLIDRDVAYDVYHNANLSWNGSGLLKYIPTVIPADK